MATDSTSVFGFELLSKLVEKQVNKKEDVIVTLVHWYFVKNGFRCIGIGDSKIFNPSESGSELLPNEWNQQPNYALRYVKDGKLYILLGTRSDADLLLNLMRTDDQSVSNIQFSVQATVSALHGSLQEVIPTFQNVLTIIRQELVDPVYTCSARESSTQTTTSNVDREEDIHRHGIRPDYDPLRVPYRPAPFFDRNSVADPGRVGSADLNPFGSPPLGGGMIFVPRRPHRSSIPGNPGLGVPGRLPPGAVPPGARFDPFGPPDINLPRPPRGQPDNDHLPPPGYDDMFM